MATRGDFVLLARQADREVLRVYPGSLRLIKPTSDAWRLRVRLLTAISGVAAVSTSFTINYLRTIHADILTGIASLGLIAAVLYPIGRFEERAIWPVLARNGVDSGLDLEFRSVEYHRFGHSLWVTAKGQEFKMTVYGPRRRVAKALEILREPRTFPDWGS